MNLFIRLLICLLLAAPLTKSYSIEQCKNRALEGHAILQNGRLKPLLVHATETLKFLSGKSSFGKKSATEAFCTLSLSHFIPTKEKFIYPLIEHVEIIKALDIKEGTKFTFDDLIESRSQLMLAKKNTIEGSSLDKSINRQLRRISLYTQIRNGGNWLVPLRDGTSIEDVEPISNLYNVIPKDSMARASEILFLELDSRQKLFNTNHPNKVRVEFLYAKAKIPLVAMLLTILSIAFLVARKKQTLGLLFLGLTIISETALIILRIYISERAPITNMYETVLFSGYAGLLLSAIIGHFKQDKMYLYIGLGYNLLSVFMLNFSGGMLSASIGPLVPVLRDNFWLSTHVTSIIASYGALALSWVLANIVLVKNRIEPINAKEISRYSDIMYTCLKYGVVLLAGGIILGGVWADYSWGRFWGWDPKETWSLIVLCVYMIILHGRYTNWINNKKFIPFTAFAFLSVMMAWFGVNYILASGLHSYGFSEGGVIFLGGFFLIQVVILAFTAPKLVRES